MGVQENGIAFLKTGNGNYTVGYGPFEESSDAPKYTTAFYRNDFSLSDARPWKIPAKVEEVSSLKEVGLAEELVSIKWEELESEDFAQVFSEINEMITRGVMVKSVPVATEQGSITEGNAESLLAKLMVRGDSFYSYGWSSGDEGFCGATPELLFSLRGKSLKTMALAGTAKSEECDVFAVDGKEIREHEFVAQTLVAKLSDIGSVLRAERSIMDLGQLVHFHTPIEVELFEKHGVDDLMRRLHPTPALGPLPRTGETLKILLEWRQRLGCPVCFGAPFGLLNGGEFTAVVAIRGIHWAGNEVKIPSGCGVIEASRLVNEWRELRLKREAVRASLNSI